ncbi:MAG: hypothetical protein AB8B82_13960 [Roseovarius sp.]
MSAAPIILNYELTQEWADALLKLNRHVSAIVRVYYTLAYVMSVAFGVVALAGIAAGVAVMLDLPATTLRLMASVAGVIGAIGMMAWATRVAHETTMSSKDAYAVGTHVAYRIDATGVGLVAHQQDWHTGWSHVRDIIIEHPALSILTPYATFSMPVDELPVPVDKAVAQMKQWQQEARKT